MFEQMQKKFSKKGLYKKIFVWTDTNFFFKKKLCLYKRYPFIIMNRDPSNKKGTHWWSFLGLYPKKEVFLFNSFGFDGFK